MIRRAVVFQNSSINVDQQICGDVGRKIDKYLSFGPHGRSTTTESGFIDDCVLPVDVV